MGLLDLLLPPACAGCGAAGELVCARCLSALVPTSNAIDRFVAPDAGVIIGDAVGLARAAFVYGGALRRSLAAVKYAGASRVAAILARAAAPVFDELLAIAGPAALVPVPLHAARHRERGYNQAELVARALARSSGVIVSPLLVRTVPTTRQHQLDRAARIANLRDAFQLSSRLPRPSSAILVDDIITTTATMEACGSILISGGVETVWGFAVARQV